MKRLSGHYLALVSLIWI